MIWIILFSFLSLFQSDWKKITIPELQFSVLSPGYMYRVIDEISTSSGPVTVYSYKYEPEDHDDNLLYLIQAYRFVEVWDVEDGDDLQLDILNVGVEESIEKLKGSLDYQQMIPMDSGLCLLYRINYAKGSRIMKSKVMIVNDTFISMQVYCESSQSLNTSMDYFLNSFSLTN